MSIASMVDKGERAYRDQEAASRARRVTIVKTSWLNKSKPMLNIMVQIYLGRNEMREEVSDQKDTESRRLTIMRSFSIFLRSSIRLACSICSPSMSSPRAAFLTCARHRVWLAPLPRVGGPATESPSSSIRSAVSLRSSRLVRIWRRRMRTRARVPQVTTMIHAAVAA